MRKLSRTMKSYRNILFKVNNFRESSKNGQWHSVSRSKCRFMSSQVGDHNKQPLDLPNCRVSKFDLNKVVLMQKVTRYEYEKHHFRNHSEEKFRELVSAHVY